MKGREQKSEVIRKRERRKRRREEKATGMTSSSQVETLPKKRRSRRERSCITKKKSRRKKTDHWLHALPVEVLEWLCKFLDPYSSYCMSLTAKEFTRLCNVWTLPRLHARAKASLHTKIRPEMIKFAEMKTCCVCNGKYAGSFSSDAAMYAHKHCIKRTSHLQARVSVQVPIEDQMLTLLRLEQENARNVYECKQREKQWMKLQVSRKKGFMQQLGIRSVKQMNFCLDNILLFGFASYALGPTPRYDMERRLSNSLAKVFPLRTLIRRNARNLRWFNLFHRCASKCAKESVRHFLRVRGLEHVEFDVVEPWSFKLVETVGRYMERLHCSVSLWKVRLMRYSLSVPACPMEILGSLEQEIAFRIELSTHVESTVVRAIHAIQFGYVPMCS